MKNKAAKFFGIDERIQNVEIGNRKKFNVLCVAGVQ